MKRALLLVVYLLTFVFITPAQTVTQHGAVKTKGRMVNGKHIRGRGLSGATISIQGRSAVLSQTNGSFSFPVPEKTFMVNDVQKKGYLLVDADATKKPYQHSANPLYLVMETPDQQMEDQLEAEEKISRTLREQLKKSRAEIQKLKDDKNITEEEYRQRVAQLMQNQQNNQKLIADMAKEYSQMDYDQMDELNRIISDAILNGELTKADSLLRSKGDIRSRDAEITRRQQAEALRKEEIAHQQEELDASKEGTRKLLEDFAADCYKYHNMFKLENKHDSAAYYIELRANRDTTNAEWQFDAAHYFHEQFQYKQSVTYYTRSLEIIRNLSNSNPEAFEPSLVKVLNNLANVYSDANLFSKSESMHNEALVINRRLSDSNPQIYKPSLAATLNNLGFLYDKTQQFDKAEGMYQQTLDLYQQLASRDHMEYDPKLAITFNNLAIIYSKTEHFEKAEEMYLKTLEISRKLSDSNPQVYEPALAQNLNNLASLYRTCNRYIEAETIYDEALEISLRLAKENPQAYEPSLALQLNNLAGLYRDTQRYEKAETTYLKSLNIRRRLVESDPQAFSYGLSRTLGSLSILFIHKKEFSKAEEYAREAISLNPSLHTFVGNLATALLLQGKYPEAETIFRQYKDEQKEDFLDDFEQLAEEGIIPKEYEMDVEKIKKLLNE